MADDVQIALAFLEMPRMTCVGCSAYLYERGMLNLVCESVIPNADPDDTRRVMTRTYRLAPGVSLAECQDAVRHRHRGPRPWGLD